MSFSCTVNGCNATFSKNSKLQIHLRRHNGERPFICDESDCDKSYTNSSHLLRHKKTFHQKVPTERITCKFEGCYLELANTVSLKKHYQRKHNEDRKYPYTCKECNQGFHRKRMLQQHSFVHSNIPPFSCDVCGTKFITVRDMNRHKRTHTEYACECGNIFERWSMLLKHRKICGLSESTCEECNKRFANKANLEEHRKIHQEKDTKNVYVCPYENCNRYYFYKKNLIYHINVYHKKMEAPKLPCTFPGCEMILSGKKNLKQHLLVHNKNNTFKKRKVRKDKGIPRKSMAAILAGLSMKQSKELESELNSAAIEANIKNKIVKKLQTALKGNELQMTYNLERKTEVHAIMDNLSNVKFIVT